MAVEISKALEDGIITPLEVKDVANIMNDLEVPEEVATEIDEIMADVVTEPERQEDATTNLNQ